jgi:4-hydroxybenzoate polyprenyltransferase
LTVQSSNSVAPSGLNYLWVLIRALKLHNWLKNTLLFVPAVFSQALSPATIPTLGVAFLAFGCAASAHYLLNDLLDKGHDRQDVMKGRRPQAAGQLSPRAAACLTAALLAASAACAAWLPAGFRLVLATYLLLCLAYSLLLKRALIIDILALVALHDLRLLGGASAVLVPLSNSLLLAFTFLFLALALLKRMGQLAATADPSGLLPGRAYCNNHAPVLRFSAAAAVATSVSAFAVFFSHVGALGLACLFLPLLAVWLGRCFFIAGRGKLNEDLVLFVIADRFSSITLAALMLMLIAAG